MNQKSKISFIFFISFYAILNFGLVLKILEPGISQNIFEIYRFIYLCCLVFGFNAIIAIIFTLIFAIKDFKIKKNKANKIFLIITVISALLLILTLILLILIK